MEMTNYKWDSVMIDADFAIKMNKLRDIKAIEAYIPFFVRKLYIHEHVYENEILTPKRTKDQIDNLIKQNEAEIVSIESFNGDEISKMIYQETINISKVLIQG